MIKYLLSYTFRTKLISIKCVQNKFVIIVFDFLSEEEKKNFKWPLLKVEYLNNNPASARYIIQASKPRQGFLYSLKKAFVELFMEATLELFPSSDAFPFLTPLGIL